MPDQTPVTPDLSTATVDPNYRRITESEFDTEFRPLRAADNDADEATYLRLEDWHNPAEWARILAARDAGRLWTCVDTEDGSWCLSSGLHYVNRQYYVISEVAVPAHMTIDVYDPDEPPHCPECGCYMHEATCAHCEAENEGGAE